LMLKRWFGRKGGMIGALTLLLASPMFVQWSISARGGYIEVLVWGTALWWAYWEWFACRSDEATERRSDEGSTRQLRVRQRALHKAVLGLLVGSGLWINPTIALFIAPMVLHALLAQPLAAARDGKRIGPWLGELDRACPTLPLTLPVL